MKVKLWRNLRNGREKVLIRYLERDCLQSESDAAAVWCILGCIFCSGKEVYKDILGNKDVVVKGTI